MFMGPREESAFGVKGRWYGPSGGEAAELIGHGDQSGRAQASANERAIGGCRTPDNKLMPTASIEGVKASEVVQEKMKWLESQMKQVRTASMALVGTRRVRA